MGGIINYPLRKCILELPVPDLEVSETGLMGRVIQSFPEPEALNVQMLAEPEQKGSQCRERGMGWLSTRPSALCQNRTVTGLN